jgi:hypothetical protein
VIEMPECFAAHSVARSARESRRSAAAQSTRRQAAFASRLVLSCLVSSLLCVVVCLLRLFASRAGAALTHSFFLLDGFQKIPRWLLALSLMLSARL